MNENNTQRNNELRRWNTIQNIAPRFKFKRRNFIAKTPCEHLVLKLINYCNYLKFYTMN